MMGQRDLDNAATSQRFINVTIRTLEVTSQGGSGVLHPGLSILTVWS